MTPFDFVKQIHHGKDDSLLNDSLSEKEYKPFVINKALSQDLDCILHANEMNLRPHLDKKLQFHYLINIIRKAKRPPQKWHNPPSNDDMEAIKTIFECSDKKAHEIISVLTEEQLIIFRELADPGGRKTS